MTRLTRMTIPALAVGVLLALPAAAYDFKDCSAQAKRDLSLALDFMRDNMRILRHDYEFDLKLPRGDTRVKRRMARKIKRRLQVHCATGAPRCKGNLTGKSLGTLTRRIHVCYEKVHRRKADFCGLVETVAHEYAHSIGMKVRLIPHNDGAPDRVYQYGWFVEDLCRQLGISRGLGDPGHRLKSREPDRDEGLVVFAKNKYRHWGRNFRDSHDDLRYIGWNDAISSVRVISGRWELCRKRDFRQCRTVDADIRKLGKIDLNNAISSIRQVDDSGESCAGAVQGKIAWNYRDSKHWNEDNVARLCQGAENSTEPAACFHKVMHSGVNWGGGTRWNWRNALSLCRGTHDAERTIACFRERVDRGDGWRKAIDKCN